MTNFLTAFRTTPREIRLKFPELTRRASSAGETKEENKVSTTFQDTPYKFTNKNGNKVTVRSPKR